MYQGKRGFGQSCDFPCDFRAKKMRLPCDLPCDAGKFGIRNSEFGERIKSIQCVGEGSPLPNIAKRNKTQSVFRVCLHLSPEAAHEFVSELRICFTFSFYLKYLIPV